MSISPPLSFDQYFWLFCPHGTRITSVSMRAPIYLHHADGHVGRVPELSCWESRRVSVSQLVLEGRYKGGYQQPNVEQAEGEKPCECVVPKHPLLLTEGPRKEASYPGPAHLAALLAPMGRASTPAFYPPRATANWMSGEEGHLRATTSSLGLPLPPLLPLFLSFCPGIFNCSLMWPSGTRIFLFRSHFGVFEGILNGNKKQKKRGMQDDNKRATTKLAGALHPS